MFDLSNTVSIVTGGNSGLGLAYGRGLVKCGGTVAIWGRNADKNATAIDELRSLGGNVESFVCDVTDEDQVKIAFEQSIEKFGDIDACFANAGGNGFWGMSHSTSRADWLGAIDLNLMSVVHTWSPITKYLIDRGRGGKLIVTSSVAALMGSGTAAGYSTTKAALKGLVQALAVELGPAGIQVNAILPGFIETEMSSQTNAAFQEACRRRSVSGQIGKLEDMEGVAVFLASTHSNYITGQSIVMDGGYTIHPM